MKYMKIENEESEQTTARGVNKFKSLSADKAHEHFKVSDIRILKKLEDIFITSYNEIMSLMGNTDHISSDLVSFTSKVNTEKNKKKFYENLMALITMANGFRAANLINSQIEVQSELLRMAAAAIASKSNVIVEIKNRFQIDLMDKDVQNVISSKLREELSLDRHA